MAGFGDLGIILEAMGRHWGRFGSLGVPLEVHFGGLAVPLGAFGGQSPPKTIGDAALFLASDLSAYITGTQLVVDGGVINQ